MVDGDNYVTKIATIAEGTASPRFVIEQTGKKQLIIDGINGINGINDFLILHHE